MTGSNPMLLGTGDGLQMKRRRQEEDRAELSRLDARAEARQKLHDAKMLLVKQRTKHIGEQRAVFLATNIAYPGPETPLLKPAEDLLRFTKLYQVTRILRKN